MMCVEVNKVYQKMVSREDNNMWSRVGLVSHLVFGLVGFCGSK